MKTRILISTSLLFLLVLFGCSPKGGETAATKPLKHIVIATLMSHPALDEVQQGLKDELQKLGYVEGKNIEIVTKNANGQVQATTTIAKELAADRPDATVAITTPMAQAAAA